MRSWPAEFLFLLASLSVPASSYADPGGIDGEVWEMTQAIEPAGYTDINRVSVPRECTASPLSASEMRNQLLCSADPFEHLCDFPALELPGDIADREDRMRKAKAETSDFVADYARRKGIKKEAVSLDDDQYSAETFARFKKFGGPTETAKVKSLVDEVVQSFKNLLKSRHALRPESRAALEDTIGRCGKDFMFIVDTDGEIGMAIVPFSGSTVLAEAREGSKPYDALKKSSSCQIHISLTSWKDCLAGGQFCKFVLSHEIGHLFNSCNVYDTGENILLGHEADDGSPLWDASNHFKLGRAHRDREKNVAQTAAELKRLGLDLEAGTACLEVVSKPAEAVPSSCEQNPRTPNWIRKKCGEEAQAGRPSQWNEAEADNWGASAFAEQLRAEKDLESRRNKVFEVIRMGCPLVSPAMRAERIKGMKAMTEDYDFSAEVAKIAPLRWFFPNLLQVSPRKRKQVRQALVR
jgi:hypothetical protein